MEWVEACISIIVATTTAALAKLAELLVEEAFERVVHRHRQ